MAEDSTDKAGLSEDEKSRREFIKAAGKLAVYTPPVLMLLMRPAKDAIAASAGTTQGAGYQGDAYEEDREGNLVWEGSEGEHSDRRFSLWR